MSVVLRSSKLTPLTHGEMDENWLVSSSKLGTYRSTVQYGAGDLCVHAGQIWRAVGSSTGVTPGTASAWVQWSPAHTHGFSDLTFVSNDSSLSIGATQQLIPTVWAVKQYVDSRVSNGGAVTSVNGKTGAVVLVPSDVGAATAAQGAKADTAVQPGSLHAVAFSGQYNALTGRPVLGTAAGYNVGVPNGLAPLNSSGKIDSQYLPPAAAGYTDDQARTAVGSRLANTPTINLSYGTTFTATLRDGSVVGSHIGDGSLGAVKLDSANSPAVGMILGYDGTKFQWVTSGTTYTDARAISAVAGALVDGVIKFTYDSSIPSISGTISNNSITSGMIAANAIGGNHIQDLSIGATKLGVASVTTDKIGPGAVTSSKIGSNQINNSHLAVNSIDESRLQNGSVGVNKLNVSGTRQNNYLIRYNQANNNLEWVDPMTISGYGDAQAIAATWSALRESQSVLWNNTGGQIRAHVKTWGSSLEVSPSGVRVAEGGISHQHLNTVGNKEDKWLLRYSQAQDRLEWVSPDNLLAGDDSEGQRVIYAEFDSGDSSLVAGTEQRVSVPFGYRITKVRVIADQAGLASIDVLKADLNDLSNAVSICSGNYIELVGQAVENTTLTGWDTGGVPGTVIIFRPRTFSTVRKCRIELWVIAAQGYALETTAGTGIWISRNNGVPVIHLLDRVPSSVRPIDPLSAQVISLLRFEQLGVLPVDDCGNIWSSDTGARVQHSLTLPVFWPTTLGNLSTTVAMPAGDLCAEIKFQTDGRDGLGNAGGRLFSIGGLEVVNPVAGNNGLLTVVLNGNVIITSTVRLWAGHSYHVAVSVRNGNIYLWVNGKLEGSGAGTVSGNTIRIGGTPRLLCQVVGFRITSHYRYDVDHSSSLIPFERIS